MRKTSVDTVQSMFHANRSVFPFCSFFTAVIHICISTTPLPLAPYCTYLLELVTGTILQFILVHLVYTVCVINLFKKII